jgi:antirestriction protein ArdC
MEEARSLLRNYVVFNVEQIGGLPPCAAQIAAQARGDDLEDGDCRSMEHLEPEHLHVPHVR